MASAGSNGASFGFAGMAPVRETLLGMVDAASDAKRQGWLDRMRDYGQAPHLNLANTPTNTGFR
jgi:putative NADPH-quinone reductase